MHKVKKMAAQGDLLLRKVDKVPEGFKPKSPTEGKHIVAHSETGHHHYVDSLNAHLFVNENPMVCYLQVEGEVDLVHARTFDTHETLQLIEGVWELRRQREYTPEGWRRVED